MRQLITTIARDSNKKGGPTKRGIAKLSEEELLDLVNIFAHYPVKVFPAGHSIDKAVSIKAVGNISIALNESGQVFTWGGGGSTPPQETALLGRTIG